MFDLIDTFLFGVICTANVTVLIGLAAIRPLTKFVGFMIAAAWISLILTISALGGFATGAIGAVPAPPLAFLLLMIVGLVAWFTQPAFRNAFLSVPLAGLIGINAFRIGAISFLILHHQGRLSAPFATFAGWGDIITGCVAIPLAAVAAWRGRLPRGLLTVWNVFGALDLIDAVTLGALSAPGTPFQVFTGAPGTAVMGTIPWVGVPAFLVPLYLMTHLAIATRLRRSATTRGQVDNHLRDIPTRRAA
jgi:hypothetical protein